MSEPLLRVQHLCKYFPVTSGVLGRRTGEVRAVDDVSFELHRGQTLSLVGESGSGKTTTGRCILRLIEPTSGSVTFDGQDVLALNKRELRALRRRMQIIFQDPYSSLNPRLTVSAILTEAIAAHGLRARAQRRDRAMELLHLVGLPPEAADRYPHEFSGGQRQRIGVARALAVEPDLIVCDEPVSALDVSIQAQVVNLLKDLQEELGIAYLFIGHDLSVVRNISHQVAVMTHGKIVEMGESETLFDNPQSAYTRSLLAAIPRIDAAFSRA
jgi:oligopeptide transport system ATP-binding protein